MTQQIENAMLAKVESPEPAQVRPASLTDGISLLPVERQQEVLAEYDKRRQSFRDWLLAHMIEGVHYGYPPGCKPRHTDKKQWQSKPTLYKAGALLLIDLLRIRPRFEADMTAWQQLGSPDKTFVMRCELVHPQTGEILGEGRGVFAVGEKQMGSNSAVKMAEKRALVDAVINTVAVCADLFTQGLDDLAPPTTSKATDPVDKFLAKKKPQISEHAKALSLLDQKRELLRWVADYLKQYNSEQEPGAFIGAVVKDLLGKPAIETPEEIEQVSEAIRGGWYDPVTGQRTAQHEKGADNEGRC